MSFQYDQYLARHRANVKRGFDWLSENLPGLMTNTLTAGWNTEFAHDQSKNEPDEYEALVLGLCRKRRTKMFGNYIFRTHLPIEQSRVSKYRTY